MVSERRLTRIGAVCALIFLLAACGARADDFQSGESGRIDAVTAFGALVVDIAEAEPLEVRLAGVRIPDAEATSGAEAIAAIEALVLGRAARLGYEGEERRDRYGRAPAQVFIAGDRREVWLQEALVEAGWALVWPEADAPASAALYPLEARAREDGRGLWADPAYAVREADPNSLALDIDSHAVVEGRVVSTANVRGRTYLNFGFDYRTDFTISVAAADRPAFDAAGVDLLALEGHRVRVRGWVNAENGPMIALDRPEKLEILSPPLPAQ